MILSLLALPITAFLVVVAHSVLQNFLSPLRALPGPKLARYTRFWYLKALLKRDFHETNINLHQKQGPIVRIAPNQYSIDDPEAIKTIYGHGTRFTKSTWYRAAGAPGPVHDLFHDMDPRSHAMNRRRVAALYSTTNLLRFEPFVDTAVKIFGDRMRELASKGCTFDLQHWLQCYAFDVIGLITFDKRFGFLDDGDDRGFFEQLDSYHLYMSSVGIYNEFHNLIYSVKSKLSGSGLSAIIDFASEQIKNTIAQAQHNEKLSERNDFATKLLQMHEADPIGFPMAKVFATSLTNIGAGSDTTSVSLSGIMYNLMKHPTCYQMLRTELDRAAILGTLSDPITYNQAQALPYLQACIKEGLRMHPATGLPMFRVVPPEGAIIARTSFPSGAIVGINSWVAHHNTQVFGSDAACFNPDRWLVNDPDQISKMDRYYIPFGVGSRTCIGRNISMMEMAKLVPQLVRRFDFALAMGPGEKLENENLWFVKQKNFHVEVRIRKE